MTTLPDRRVQITSAPNMRDLGGIPVADGVVRDRRLYRSATLARLTDDDMPGFAELGVATVFDLRTAGEREQQPDRLPDGVRSRPLDVLADSAAVAAAGIVDIFADPAAAAPLLKQGTAQRAMEATYRDFVTLPSAVGAYRTLLSELADPADDAPALFHCTTGKDRTGWAAATFLLLLGADEDAVRADYLQTNTDLLPALEPVLAQAEEAGLARELLLPVLGVRESYLDAALEQMRADFGTIRDYALDGLGLTPAQLDAMRGRYVETT